VITHLRLRDGRQQQGEQEGTPSVPATGIDVHRLLEKARRRIVRWRQSGANYALGAWVRGGGGSGARRGTARMASSGACAAADSTMATATAVSSLSWSAGAHDDIASQHCA
jgi:hypothetical protein